jgi:hypothetical protein
MELNPFGRWTVKIDQQDDDHRDGGDRYEGSDENQQSAYDLDGDHAENGKPIACNIAMNPSGPRDSFA